MVNFCDGPSGCGSNSSHIFPKLKPFNLSAIVRVPKIFTSDANVTGTLKFCRLSDFRRIKSSGIRIPDNVPPMFNDFLNITLSIKCAKSARISMVRAIQVFFGAIGNLFIEMRITENDV